YDIIKEFSDRRLTQEIFAYGKMQVDREVMGIINQLMKIVYPLEKVEFTFKGINAFLPHSKKEIRTILVSNEYFGFQVLRSWYVYRCHPDCWLFRTSRAREAILENTLLRKRPGERIQQQLLLLYGRV